jgi:23S rRNA pseudouridine2605 synthase
MPAERLQKLIAAAGVASRRHAEELIAAGRVTVNGIRVTTPGAKADPTLDIISVDGQPVAAPVRHTYLAMNKPRGILTSVSDDRGRRTVIDLLPPDIPRVVPVGRLDLDSEGLLLLTDDGDFALRVSHPRFAVEKEYLAVAGVPVPASALEALRSGVVIDGARTKPADVRAVQVQGLPPGRTYRVTIHEGRNRQVRKMFATQGIKLGRLIRTRVGPVRLESLGPGAIRPLSREEKAGFARLSPHATRSRVTAVAPRP